MKFRILVFSIFPDKKLSVLLIFVTWNSFTDFPKMCFT
ncbi:hypothetical protein DVDV_4116 [Desulfovibrio sp. DV]|nr:hypothetical protein DVDV_4116 [Desulfovibrio sp. DV]